MRKQLAKVGAVTVAAMMVGTTAFAANLEATDIEVVYTDLNTVTVSVPVANTSDNATILSVANGTLLDSIGNDNANTTIVYIDQDGVSNSAANLRIADAAGEVEFTFNTERAGVAESDGKIDIFAAGSTYGVNAAAASIYKNAPAKSFAFTDATGISLPAGADAAAIKAAFADKNVTVTHQTTGADVTSTTTGANAGMSYALNGNSVTVTFDPALATNAKYDSVSGEPLTVEVPVTVEESPAVITAAELQANNVMLPKDFTGEITKDVLIANGLKVKVVYTTDKNTHPSADVAAADFEVAVSGDASPYNVTISSTKNFENNTTVQPITITATVRTGDDVAITGTVKAQSNPKLAATAKAAGGVLVAAYSEDGTTLQGVALSDATGAFNVTVPGAGTYKLVISYVAVSLNGNAITGAVNYGATVKMVDTAASTDVGEVVLVKLLGDANGDGVVNAKDKQEVNTGKGNSYFTAE